MPRTKMKHIDEMKIVEWIIDNDLDFYVMVDEYGLHRAINKIYIRIHVAEFQSKKEQSNL